jgi:hypothetical protein
VLDLATLAPKIAHAECALQQEAANAVALVDEHERSALLFCRRLIAIIRVALDETKSQWPTKGWHVILIGILVRLIATVRAAHTLAAAGHALEVSIVVRSVAQHGELLTIPRDRGPARGGGELTPRAQYPNSRTPALGHHGEHEDEDAANRTRRVELVGVELDHVAEAAEAAVREGTKLLITWTPEDVHVDPARRKCPLTPAVKSGWAAPERAAGAATANSTRTGRDDDRRRDDWCRDHERRPGS